MLFMKVNGVFFPDLDETQKKTLCGKMLISLNSMPDGTHCYHCVLRSQTNRAIKFSCRILREKKFIL